MPAGAAGSLCGGSARPQPLGPWQWVWYPCASACALARQPPVSFDAAGWRIGWRRTAAASPIDVWVPYSPLWVASRSNVAAKETYVGKGSAELPAHRAIGKAGASGG